MNDDHNAHGDYKRSSYPLDHDADPFAPSTIRAVTSTSPRPMSPTSIQTYSHPVSMYTPPAGRPPFRRDTLESDTTVGETDAGHYPPPMPRHSRASTAKYNDNDDTFLNKDSVERGEVPGFNPLDYEDPYAPPDRRLSGAPLLAQDGQDGSQPKKGLARFFGGAGDNPRYPLQQRIEDKKRGIGRQRYPFVAWAFTAAMTGLLIYELVYNWQQQGNPFSFKPTVNPMLGPSTTGLITLGARWPACMRDVPGIPSTLTLPCPNNTANPATIECSIETLCAFGGFHNKTPNQWYRFITPIFLHAGLIHLALNMLAQMTLSAQVEREMGSGAFLILYMAAGIFGNVLGGNFALVGVPSVGASGAIFGTVAVLWVDLIAHWQIHYQPTKKLVMLIIDLIVGVALGYIPGVDNFAHLGGYAVGLLCAAIFYPVISQTKRHKLIMWAVRIAAIPLVVALFVVLIRNFYTDNPFAACGWCRYLSCIPRAANNQCKGNHHYNVNTLIMFRALLCFVYIFR